VSLVSIDGTALKAALARARSGIVAGAQNAVARAAKAGEHLAKSTERFKDRSTSLRRSIRAAPSRPGSWFVKAGAKHAVFIVNGTKPHIIRARNAKALRFIWHGRLTFRKWVKHPGTKARPFMDDMAKGVWPLFTSGMSFMLRGVVDEFNR